LDPTAAAAVKILGSQCGILLRSVMLVLC